MQKILLQKLFFLTENFRKFRPLPYGIGLDYSKKIVWSRVAEFFLEIGILTENQSKNEIVWLQTFFLKQHHFYKNKIFISK